MPKPEKPMQIGNFDTIAPRYWDRGLTVIPVPHNTREASSSYEGLVNQMPHPATRNRLLGKHGSEGLGLIVHQELDDGSRTGAVDVDDDRLTDFVREIVGVDAPAKFGSKGMTFFVRVEEGVEFEVKQIKNKGMGDTPVQLLDFLVGGNKMTVLPPTLHWKTGEPYRWTSDRTLPDTPPSAWPLLSQWRVNLLLRVLQWKRLSEVIGGDTTHDAMRDLIFYSMGWFGPDEDDPDMELMLHRALPALLPKDYTGNTLKELNAPERGSGLGWGALRDDRNNKKRYPRPSEEGPGGATKKMLRLLEESAGELFHDRSGTTYIPIRCEGGGALAVPTNSTAARNWIRITAYRANLPRVPSEQAEKQIIGLLHARALAEGPEREVFVRVGRSDNNRLVIDLGIPNDGRAIVIDPDAPEGFRVTAEHGVQFWRPDGLLPLPLPTASRDLAGLRALLGAKGEDNWARVLAFTLASLRSGPPYMGLSVTGLEGSGKSVLCDFIKRLLDPTEVMRSILPVKIDDMAVLVNHKRVTVFDNVSGMDRAMSDALCMVLTGGGLEKRTLYSDGELFVLRLARPVILNGISEIVSQSDLMSRLIALEADDPEKRRTEAELRATFDAIHPAALGALCYIAAQGLKVVDQTSADPENRNADVMQWLVACEPHTGLKPGTFVRAIAEAQAIANTDRVTNEPAYVELMRVIQSKPFEGSATDLFRAMTNDDTLRSAQVRGFPQNAAALGKWVTRNQRVLAKLGVLVSQHRDAHGTHYRLWREGKKPGKANKLADHLIEEVEKQSHGKY